MALCIRYSYARIRYAYVTHTHAYATHTFIKITRMDSRRTLGFEHSKSCAYKYFPQNISYAFIRSIIRCSVTSPMFYVTVGE